jgi:site-specific DNA-methyltransferase (adenine-specific)
METNSSRYELINADVFEALKTIRSETIDFIFVDPPYFLSNGGLSVKSGKAVSVNKGKWDESSGFQGDVDFHRRWITECLRVLKPTGTIAISGTYHSIYQCGYILQEIGCRIVNDIVWFKPNGAPSLAGRNFTASHETIIWASKSSKVKHTFNYATSKSWDYPQDKLLNPGKQMRSVWSIPTTPKREKEFGTHPTQKPLELLNRLVSMCTSEGELVLDPFCGSGTTGVAAIIQGRKFVGIDLDKAHIELARRRIEASF